jgi:hypothetical protein
MLRNIFYVIIFLFALVVGIFIYGGEALKQLFG